MSVTTGASNTARDSLHPPIVSTTTWHIGSGGASLVGHIGALQMLVRDREGDEQDDEVLIYVG